MLWDAIFVYVRILDLIGHLNLIDKDIILLILVRCLIQDIFPQCNRIPVGGIFLSVKCHFNDMIIFYSRFQKMLFVKLKQKKRFAASANAGDNLHFTVPLMGDDSLQVFISFDDHIFIHYVPTANLVNF